MKNKETKTVTPTAPVRPYNEYFVGDRMYPSLKITGSVKWTDFYTAKSTVDGCPKYGYYTQVYGNNPIGYLTAASELVGDTYIWYVVYFTDGTSQKGTIPILES